LGRRDHEIGIHDSRHRRENDGKFSLEEVEKSAVRPHGLLAWMMGVGAGVVAGGLSLAPRALPSYALTPRLTLHDRPDRIDQPERRLRLNPFGSNPERRSAVYVKKAE
jgi:hypothetical protein